MKEEKRNLNQLTTLGTACATMIIISGTACIVALAVKFILWAL